ncbi:FecCD family ABC transporter permease [Actinophytocola algeriensis]|uniref:Iron complex transport system permease protein n=1 Tax=Actinophytocola algeriensis TaxID=1768010 RepID=A0A7W7VBJ6_9PSEU|nr:iron chelate uptake ABC transporter family permease subunit [Actinophytocola algeriensis]MBB4904198.1 iron complex transport system permease protein [Actinophytocola algeriensis]MBE1476945.1 iron complex transport system permease protein [Actinophytocola algeriensis]
MIQTHAAPVGAPARGPSRRRGTYLFAGLAVLLVLCVLSLAIGTRNLPPGEVVAALFGQGDGSADAIIWGTRFPRTLMGIVVGVALGLAGAVMQALTRNPLGDPGLLGISAGAAFGIVVAVATTGIASLYGYIWFAFAGAAVASVVVYLLGSAGRGGATPVKLALAGVAITALLTSLTNGISLVDPEALNRYRFWASGSLAGQDNGVLLRVLPFIAVGTVMALASANAFNSMALGDDVAKALGRRVALTRLQGAVAVTLLTGAAVAVVGPIVFVGLVVPHVARAITGPDHRWLLPYSMVLSPILVLAADVIGRVVGRPGEVDVGIVVAFIGAPFFIALVRRRRLAEL